MSRPLVVISFSLCFIEASVSSVRFASFLSFVICECSAFRQAPRHAACHAWNTYLTADVCRDFLAQQKRFIDRKSLDAALVVPAVVVHDGAHRPLQRNGTRGMLEAVR
jgi:hypothetical protein